MKMIIGMFVIASKIEDFLYLRVLLKEVIIVLIVIYQ